jgi:hypothetical protein
MEDKIVDDFDIGPDEIAMFMGMAEEMAEEERERFRIEKEFERSDKEEEFEQDHNHSEPEYQHSDTSRRPKRDAFMQWVWDLSHNIKTIDDPLYGPPKPRKGKRGSKEDYTKAIILGVPIINAHLVSENFLHFIQIALHYFPKHEIDSIIFDQKGQPVVNDREIFGIFNASSRSIVINLRYHFNNAVHIVEHGHTNFSMHAIIWNSMIEVFLHELWHALDTIGDPDLIYLENKDIDDIATGWAQELMTFLAQNENIEPPKLTEDPYFGVRIIKYINRIIAEGRHLWAETQREMMAGGVYYRNTHAEIEITSLKEFIELSLPGLTTDGTGSRLNECVMKEQKLEAESFKNENACELAIKEAIEKGYRLKIDYIRSDGVLNRGRIIKPIRFFLRDGYGYVDAFCELKKNERTFRTDHIINITF